jgi:hypothetical protein
LGLFCTTKGLELSTEKWEDYTASDYDSPEIYCRSCLIDLNDRNHYTRDAKNCYFPMVAPRKSKILYLDALRRAEQFLIDPKNEYFFGDRQIRIQAASTLISYLELFSQAVDPALIELSESE